MSSQKEANNLASLFLILCILFPLNNVNAQTDNSIFSVRKASLSKDVLEYSPIHLDNQWIYTQIDNEGVIMSSLGSNKNTPITGFNLRKSIVTGFAKSYQGGLIAISYGDTKTNVPTKLKNNKIWFAYQDKNGFASKYFEFALNSSNYSCTTPFISNDGTKLYFSSDKPGGYGGFDLYVCDYRGKEWSTPRNLGPIINTENDEVYPNLVDNILFFSSNGHGGARMDIFIADMGNDKGRLVINAGSPINSPADDYSMTFDNNTRTGYFLSDRDGVNGKVFEVTNEKKLLLINIKSNDDKKAISGAKLDLSRCKKNPMYANSKGSIILPMSIGENCFVQIGKVGYNATTLMIDYNEVVGLKKAVDIYLSEEGVFYKGKVTDENGGPAVEVELSIIDQATGENGAYSAALEPLSFYLIRTKSLYFDQKETKFATLAEVPQTILGSIQLQSNGKKQSALQPINIDDIKVVEKTEPTNSQTSGNSVSDFVEVEATKKIENAKGPETNVSQAQKIMDENDKKASIETKPEVISSSDQPESVISEKPAIIEVPKENRIMEGVKYAIQLAAVSTDNTNLNPYIEKTQGKKLIVVVNNDVQQVMKKDKIILDEQKIIKSAPKSMPKTIDTYNEPIITKVAEPKVEYKIRLSTLRDPKLFNGSKVKQYGLVEEVLTGNLVTFYLSGFENKEEAKEVIDNVKESGFPAAQIVKLMNGEYSIDN